MLIWIFKNKRCMRIKNITTTTDHAFLVLFLCFIWWYLLVSIFYLFVVYKFAAFFMCSNILQNGMNYLPNNSRIIHKEMRKIMQKWYRREKLFDRSGGSGAIFCARNQFSFVLLLFCIAIHTQAYIMLIFLGFIFIFPDSFFTRK